ncbi:MAG: ABC transporter ATP-binding protein [Thermosynechococcus sp. Uc]|uniref:dipeptide ABC transporter ATP-binding protein n=1 Tax=Thermosynechococcus sp. Uc TaxID=3034853 RepID=UPI001A091243|nr:ABC transporter ATP-binding protein [Thermosynechococcus sp. Uc]MDM7327754.1 ABC transporter ATP-binding protein [Thermosynechococcus sp. Uc]HIK24655.1 ABC transporter ATP-binding protein [Thermosynechococcus sp. M46_R2017_013]
MATLLELRELRVAYPTTSSAATFVVDGVSFCLAAGERFGLVGESGCGKSTIGKAVLQLLPPGSQVTGEITIQGQSLLGLTTSQLQRLRGEQIGLVFQDPMTRFNPLMSIYDHCDELLRSHGSALSRCQRRQRIVEVLDRVKIPANRLHQYPHELSGGMRQRVAIALALLLNPPLIIADEPTTALDVTVAAEILDELTRLCQEEQRGLLLISHDLALMAKYCDRLAVMHQGKIVEMGAARQVLQQPQHPYTQFLLAASQLTSREPPPLDTAPELLQVHNLQRHYRFGAWLQPQITIRAVDGVNLTLRRGETLGLVGESGCGKSTLSRLILQLIPASAGEVVFLGRNLGQLPAAQLRTVRRDLQMIFQDPHACLNPKMTVGQNLLEPLLIHRLLEKEAAQERVREMLAQVELTPVEAYVHRYPHALSGGQRQRVAIARALITHPQVVICDEPVSMLDAHIQRQILALMQQLKEQLQLTYLFITHDLAVARSFCDRIAVMFAGKIVELAPTAELFAHPRHPYTQRLLTAAFGLL